MDQTMVTLLIAGGGAAVGVAAIAGGYIAAQAAKRDADAATRDARQAKHSNVEMAPGEGAGSRAAATTPVRRGKKMTPEQQILELRRTRTILLGVLSVLEALALGEASRVTTARANLGDVLDCNLWVIGDAGVVGKYLSTAKMLRAQIGRGLPADAASELASVRVNLLTALAQQERRLLRGEEPLKIEPIGNPDFLDLTTGR